MYIFGNICTNFYLFAMPNKTKQSKYQNNNCATIGRSFLNMMVKFETICNVQYTIHAVNAKIKITQTHIIYI